MGIFPTLTSFAPEHFARAVIYVTSDLFAIKLMPGTAGKEAKVCEQV